VHLAPHAQFRRSATNADDVEVDVPIDFDQALLGTKVDVPTLEGHAHVTIPAGTSSGVHLRLRGKGARRKTNPNERGDLFAVVQIKVPREVPPRARELIEEFARLTRK
jgi:DnaJ-class molecular chaperone